MANNAQKTWMARTLNATAQAQALNAIGVLGKALPATVKAVAGSIVTVTFQVTGYPQIPAATMPAAGSAYFRAPIQVGDKGVVLPSDVSIGAASGLGAGQPNVSSIYGNLSSLVWLPIGNAGWAAADDPNAACIYGPDGAILASIDKSVIVRFTKAAVSITPAAGVPIQLNGDVQVSGALQIAGAIEAVGGGVYAGDLKTSGNVIAGVGGADQVGLTTHKHGGVQTGGGQSGAPTPGT